MPDDTILYSDTDTVRKLDDVDRAILSNLFQSEYGSHREMARQLGIPRSTIEYRLRKLRCDGVIVGAVHFISARKIKVHVFKLLIYMRGIGRKQRKALIEFACVHPNIVNALHCIGNWDLEFTVEVADSYEITALTQLLYKNFGDILSHVEVLPVFNQTQPVSYMRDLLV